MTDELVNLLQSKNDRWDLSIDGARIRCLAHIIHLSVLELLVALGVVKRPSAKEVAPDLSPLSEGDAEKIGVESVEQEEGGKEDDDILREQCELEDEFDSSPFSRVSPVVWYIQDSWTDGHVLWFVPNRFLSSFDFFPNSLVQVPSARISSPKLLRRPTPKPDRNILEMPMNISLSHSSSSSLM